MNRSLMALGFLIAIGATAVAQESFEFKGTGWVNSKPLDFSRLRGKIVVLMLFEES